MRVLRRANPQLSKKYTVTYFSNLDPVCDNEKENWRILTSKEFYTSVRKPNIIETIRLNRLHWFGHVQRMGENRIPKRILYRLSQELNSIVRDLIPKLMLIQKRHVHMGPIRNGSGVTSF